MRLDGDDLEDGQLLDQLLGFLPDEAGILCVPPRPLQVKPVNEGTCGSAVTMRRYVRSSTLS